MTLYKWSQTASADATADGTINWSEGQSPSSVNDSARAMMAATAKYRDDIAGAIVTGGTSTAYTVSSYEVFDTLAHMNGQMIAFTPHITNTATVTLNVDSLGARPLRAAPGVELLAGTIIQGTPYVAVYSNSDAAFYLRGFFGNPYNIPLGGGLPFFGPTAPNSSFVFPYGQAISRVTYSTLFSLLGATYGGGDGSTTFNVPDLRGRTLAGKDDMGGSAASRLTSTHFGTSAAALGAVGGSESNVLAATNLPSITSTNASQAITVLSSLGTWVKSPTGIVDQSNVGGAGNRLMGGSTAEVGVVTSTGNNSISVTSMGTTSNPHANVQPTIVCNYILRII